MQKENWSGVCPYITTQKILKGKWAIYILFILSNGTIRFNELLRQMPEKMTHTTLSRQLKALEEKGMIIRRDYSEVPPRVEYSLSEIGEKFRSVLIELEKWGEDYIEFIEEKEERNSSEND